MKRILISIIVLVALPVSAQRFLGGVSTLVDLRNYPLPNNNTNVFVAGRTVAGDGFEGLFTWVSGDSTTTNLGTVFTTAVAGQTGRWKRQYSGALNVKWFGARGDGTDQTVAIQNAYDTIDKTAGGELFFPAPRANYTFNLSIVDRNIGLRFESFIKEDSGPPIIVSNIVKAADVALPIITIGNGTTLAKGSYIIGGTFVGNGSSGVLLRLAGGAYECIIDGAQFYNAKTNVWVQGHGSQPCSLNRFILGSCLAANTTNTRGFYAAQPDAGTGYTTGTSISDYHFNSQTGVAAGNTYVMEIDGTQLAMVNSYFDITTNCPILFSQTAGVNIQPPLIKCSGVTFDGGSVIVIAEENYGASPRISSVLQGGYSIDGTFKLQSGTIISSEKSTSPVVPAGQFAAPNLNGKVSFDRIGSTTNRTWNYAEADDSDPTIFSIFATNGTMHLNGRTNISFSTGSGSDTNKLMYLQPGMLSITNSWANVSSLKIYGAGSGIYSDVDNPTVRIFTSSQSNTVRSALHLDSYQQTPAFPISLDFGLNNSTNGAYTSRILHFANVNTNRASKLQAQTHSDTVGVWNNGWVLETNGYFGIGITNPTVSLDVQYDGRFGGTNLGIRGITYAWPASQSAAFLKNDGSGNLSWTTTGIGAGTVTSFSEGAWANLMGVSTATTTPTLTADDPGAHRLYGWDDTDGAPTMITIGSGLAYDQPTHTLSSTGSGGSATNAYSIVMEEGVGVTARTNLNFIGSSATATDNAGSVRTDVTFDSDLNALASNTGNGLWARTGTGTGSARTITGSEGTAWSNGDGVSGNPTSRLDINGLTVDSSPDFASDYLASYDASAGTHKKVLLNVASPTYHQNQVIGIGTDYTITDTDQLVIFGTQSAAVTLPSAGVYLIHYKLMARAHSTKDLTFYLYDTVAGTALPASGFGFHCTGDLGLAYTYSGTIRYSVPASRQVTYRGLTSTTPYDGTDTVISTNTFIGYTKLSN